MKNSKCLIGCIFIFIFISCNIQKDTEISFNHFSIILPENWKRIKINGIDSTVDVVITKNGDSVYFDFGKFSESFKETNKIFSKEQIKKYESMGMDTNGLFFSQTPEIDQAQGTFLKEFYYYDTINDRIAKIKVPKKGGKGEVAVYFDSINNQNDKLTILGKNLKEEDEKTLLKSFQTIKFKKINR